MELLSRTAEFIATVIAVLAAITYVEDASMGQPIIPVVPFLLAAVILVIGRSCRHLADHY